MEIFIVIPLEGVDWNDFIVPEGLILASFTRGKIMECARKLMPDCMRLLCVDTAPVLD
jgi:hypothetical protein